MPCSGYHDIWNGVLFIRSKSFRIKQHPENITLGDSVYGKDKIFPLLPAAGMEPSSSLDHLHHQQQQQYYQFNHRYQRQHFGSEVPAREPEGEVSIIGDLQPANESTTTATPRSSTGSSRTERREAGSPSSSSAGQRICIAQCEVCDAR